LKRKASDASNLESAAGENIIKKKKKKKVVAEE